MKPTRWYSDRQEKKIAKLVGGKQQSNSGATTFQKGDVKTSDWLIEAKTCEAEKKSFSVKREWLEKNREEAFAMRKAHSALAIDFGDGEQFFIVDAKTFVKMCEALNGVENDYIID